MKKWHVSMNVKVDGQNYCAEDEFMAETKEQAENLMFERYKKNYECSNPVALELFDSMSS